MDMDDEGSRTHPAFDDEPSDDRVVALNPTPSYAPAIARPGWTALREDVREASADGLDQIQIELRALAALSRQAAHPGAGRTDMGLKADLRDHAAAQTEAADRLAARVDMLGGTPVAVGD
ncbi:MAG: hypothetical protein WBF53_15970, partial [Litorimonas sp.]